MASTVIASIEAMPITEPPGGMRSTRPCSRKNGARALTPTTRSQSATLTSPNGRDSSTPAPLASTLRHAYARAGTAHGSNTSLDVEEIGRHVRPWLRARRRHRIHRHHLEAVVRQAL